MTNETFDFLDDLPHRIEPTVKMSSPNQVLDIYNGIFELRHNETTIEVQGSLQFHWTPRSCSILKGVIQVTEENYYEVEQKLYLGQLEVYISGLLCGECYVADTNINLNLPTTINLTGYVSGDVIIGDKSVSVPSINFSILNMLRIHGERIQFVDSSSLKRYSGRISFEALGYKITIDSIPDIDKSLTELKFSGGYNITYGGKIEKQNNSISFQEANSVLEAFGLFISLINGRVINPLFLQGQHDGNILWTSYRNSNTRTYKEKWSLFPERTMSSDCNINFLWIKFFEKWKSSDNDQEALKMAVNWYTEVNSGDVYLESSLVTAQTALELLYNWVIVETKKIIIGGDAANISASNKIRILLSQIHVESTIPPHLDKLIEFKSENSEMFDGPEIIVQIRNAIIHSQLEKRKKLLKIDPYVKLQAKDLSLWYIEMTILNLLGYNGSYMDRRSRMSHDKQKFVPWRIAKT